MVTESFSIEEFSQVLESNGYQYDKLGWISGEYCFAVDLGKQVSIRIRSSIHHNGTAAASGEDSIRCYLTYKGQSLAAKDVPTGINERYIQRTHGWQERLVTAIERLKLFRQTLGDCRVCGKPNIARVSRTAKNPGRVFTKCIECNQWGAWLDTDEILQQGLLLLTGTSNTESQTNKQTDKKELLVPISGNQVSVETDKQEREWRVANLLDGPEKKNDSLMTGLSFLSSASALTIEPEDKPQVKLFTPSKYQEQIADFFESGQGHGGVKAYAGCAKTSSMVFSVKRLPQNLKIKMMVFAKLNALDMTQKVPEYVEATTANAAGYHDILRIYPNVKLEERKTWMLIDKRYANNWDVKAFQSEISKLLSLCKQTLKEPNEESLDWLCERFNVVTNGNAQTIYDATSKLYQDSLDISEQLIDFDDQILLPALGRVPVETCDFLIVDEQQDTNMAQQAYYLKVGGNGRTVYVGDEFQAIMGFRGADTEAMQRFEDALHPTMFTLPICYRCPQKVIELAQTIVPQIQARENAPMGIVEDISQNQFNSKVQPGDMVLCRLNAPLVKPAFELIRDGKKAIIKGRDIGKNLMTLIKRVSRKSQVTDFRRLLTALTQYVEVETFNLTAAHKEGQAASLQDQFDTIIALSNGIHSIEELQQRITKIFSDDVEGIVFSSVHKAKGLESNRVFVLNPELMPFKKATKGWEIQQERHLQYVCWTRSKSELFFVR